MTEPLDLRSQYTGGDYVYLLTGDGKKTNAAGQKLIDCSHMVNLLLTGAGYKIPYEPTESMNASSYYTEVTPEEVKTGDIALWINIRPLDGATKPLFHTGIVMEFNSKSNAGKFFGAQSKKGPSEALFGTKPPAYYWPVPTKFLRAKEEYRTGEAPLAPSVAPAPAPTARTPAMSFQYPIRKPNGSQYEEADEIYSILEKEVSGNYLLGGHNFWHGGIHISELSAPQCISDQPVRCIADGVVVAYRLNEDYIKSEFEQGGSKTDLSYSSSFCLVRHDYKAPGKSNEKGDAVSESVMTFFSLYMHLLPFVHYASKTKIERLRPVYWQGRIRARVAAKGLQLRNPPELRANGAKAGESISADMVLCTSSIIEFDSEKVLNLNVNGKLLKMAECTFVPSTSTIPTGLKKGGTIPPTFWACVENVKPNHLVDWEPITPTNFDNVVLTNIAIKAGDPIGYFGLNEVLAGPAGGKSSKHQVHLEVFSSDDIAGLIKNPKGLVSGNQHLVLDVGTDLYKRSETDGKISFSPKQTPLKVKVTVPVGKAKVSKDSDGKEWYGVSIKGESLPLDGFLKKDGATILCQHDWEKLGFSIVKENNENSDGFLDVDAMPDFFKKLYSEVDGKGVADGNVTVEELQAALRDVDLRSRWTKLIAYHPTEWQAKSSESKWARLKELLKDTPAVLKHEQERIDKLVFWDEMAGAMQIALPKSIYHFHPVAFIDNLKKIHVMTIEEARIRAFLRMLKIGEGTAGLEGYEHLFGGESFIKDYGKTFADHPRLLMEKTVKKTGEVISSTAAGAYQVMKYVWDDPNIIKLRKEHGITDFTPAMQDRYCVVILKYRRDALPEIMRGDIKAAIKKCNKEWASLPGSPYGQPTVKLEDVVAEYNNMVSQELAGESDLPMKVGFVADLME
ncbi:glycoside hydrolase family 24 protein [Pseudomonas nunensis]|uniref:glycoside hydrolase family 24 protein n=1 Tax=Pseudomonas nunensis TaxID=2961896 RepID=UPI0025AF0E0D|nr:glycoside hydrolase family 104 protein [Pseudomonas nunensis]MDN3218811.1 glycoside hydrolase family 104 protein [Pseudomonas nunensis]